MAKVSLRIYNREIEGLIDQGQTDEAIAHCRHILKTFPKHLETYRLLGKSYLETRRYGEAVDIFSRVLMSVPDDFVSHVGMSIINDEQNRLDNAIWHMERAFESQPSNAAIQGELQRLYARRDGMEPPKVRMTRGALAHMYVQGELYPQAIAEIRAVLSQDAQRTDMQVLLAKAYFKSGQKADASDLCGQLIKKSPYSFDANRIMVELLPATSAESTQVYRSRVGELDPYAIYSKESVFRSNEVADAAVNLERLEYRGQEVPIGQDWSSSLGIKLGEGTANALGAGSSSDEPDWLKAAATPNTQADGFGSAQPASNQNVQANDEIPDFLRAAGWGESSGAPEQPTSIFDSPEPASSNDNDLVSASLPDWLKGQMPTDSAPASKETQQEPVADLDWLNGLSVAAQAAQPSHGDMPDWLSDSATSSSQTAAAQTSDVPDWLSGLGNAESQPASNVIKPDSGIGSQPISESAASDVPDWLSGLGSAETQPPPAPVTKPDLSAAVEDNSSDVPDWLSGLGSTQTQPPSQPVPSQPVTQSSDVPDWLAGLGDPKTTDPVAAQENSTPDWLSGLDTPAAEGENQTLQSSDVPDWLSRLDNSSSANASTPAATDAPDWLSGFDENPATTGQPDQPAANIDSLGASAQEQDDAVAWLESLAAKHGAKPEELVTDPTKRSDTAPDWVKQATVANEAQPASESPATVKLDSLGSTAQEQDDAVAWLESLAAKHGAKPEELVTDPTKRSDTAPDWVKQASAIGESQPATVSEPTQNEQVSENAKNIGEQFFADFESASTATPAMDQTGMWLKSLDEKESPGEPIKEGDVPDWLSSAQSSAAEKGDLPNWMSDNQQLPQQEFVSENLSQDDLSNWLSNLEDSGDSQKESQSVSSAKQDLPDWLGDIDSKAEAQEDDWQKPLESAMDTKPASRPTEGPATVRMTNEPPDLPDWLKNVDQTPAPTPANVADEDNTPPWLHRESWEAEERTIEPTPIKSSDWHPVEAVEASQPKETPKPVAPSQPKKQETPLPQPIQQAVIQETKMQTPPKQQQPKKAAAKQETSASAGLTQAKGELDRGDIPAALEHYEKLIKKGKHLEETIRDLTDSLYRYPVEVAIWQTLGDAYMRGNRLKEALEAYNKAEELIR